MDYDNLRNVCHLNISSAFLWVSHWCNGNLVDFISNNTNHEIYSNEFEWHLYAFLQGSSDCENDQTHRLMEQNWEPRYKTTYVWANIF